MGSAHQFVSTCEFERIVAIGLYTMDPNTIKTLNKIVGTDDRQTLPIWKQDFPLQSRKKERITGIITKTK